MDTTELEAALPKLCVEVGPAISEDASQDISDDGLGAVVAKPSQLWDHGTVIDYCFFQGRWQGTQFQQNAFSDIVKGWEPFSNIVFRKVDNQNATIRIAFDPSQGSYSAVGTDCKLAVFNGSPTLNLGWVLEGAQNAAENRGTILHEVGHALGLKHEHQSPARGGTLTLNEQAIIWAYRQPPNSWSEAQTRRQIINVLNKQDTSNYSELDVDSIMMYNMPAAFNQQNIEIPRHHDLSQMDKAYMLINYPREQPAASTPEWTFEHALQVAKVDARTTATLLQQYNNKQYDRVRATFNNWNAVMQSGA